MSDLRRFFSGTLIFSALLAGTVPLEAESENGHGAWVRIDSGPVAKYAPGWNWDTLYWTHANAGRVAGPPAGSWNEYCVHPDYDLVGVHLQVVSGGEWHSCRTGDMVRSHHKWQWRQSWAIEVSDSMYWKLDSPGYVEVYAWDATAQIVIPEECYIETGFCLRGDFLHFWHQHGGVPLFGFPISEPSLEVTAQGDLVVQMLERARFELHPDGTIMLGRIGAELAEQK